MHGVVKKHCTSSLNMDSKR